MKQQERINEVFTRTFGRTSLKGRLDDVFDEAVEVRRFTDMRNLREEAGDLLTSTLQLCTECGWDADDLIDENILKIKRRENQYKTLGRKKVVAIYGGAFDPPTTGHVAVAQFVLNTSKVFDEVWLVPCFQHMYNKPLTPAIHRMEMCKLATQVDGRMRVSEYEIENKLKGEALHFIKRLQDEPFAKDEYEFSFIIGLDNANTFSQWVGYEELQRLIRFVVVPREGIDRDMSVDWYLKHPHIFLQDESDIPDTSSTEARDLLKKGVYRYRSDLVSLVPESVLNYIEANNLYKD
jgi:nicotinate-nucleotide adenylyltransferase